MKILPLFPSSVFMDFVEEDTDELKEYDGEFFVTEYGDGNKVSDDRRILENYPRIKKLLMKKFNKVVEFMSWKQEFMITTSWITECEPSQDCQLHNHRNSFYSGVYYYDEYENTSGNIKFENPVFSLNCFYVKSQESNIHNSHHWNIPPQKNKLLFFPSYLKHQIDKHDGENNRKSLAFNIVPIGEYGEGDSTYNTSWIT